MTSGTPGEGSLMVTMVQELRERCLPQGVCLPDLKHISRGGRKKVTYYIKISSRKV